jgi:hypothetical protein
MNFSAHITAAKYLNIENTLNMYRIERHGKYPSHKSLAAFEELAGHIRRKSAWCEEFVYSAAAYFGRICQARICTIGGTGGFPARRLESSVRYKIAN